jgi:hypothetical protein
MPQKPIGASITGRASFRPSIVCDMSRRLMSTARWRASAPEVGPVPADGNLAEAPDRVSKNICGRPPARSRSRRY